MKKSFLFTLLLLMLQNMAFSQGRILLQDDFKNNKNGWELRNDPEFLVDIKNGFLHIEKFGINRVRNGCLWYNKTIPKLNTLKNFSITLYARFFSGGDVVDMIDMQWGKRDNTTAGRTSDNLYQLNFLTKRAEVKLDYFNYRWNYSVRKNVKNLIEENAYKPGEVNKYELVQKDGFVIFSINDKEFLRQLINPIAGNSIGFQECLKSVWEIDKIIVRQLPGDEKIIDKDTTIALPALDNHSQINNPGDKELKVYPNPFTNNLHININLDKEETVQLFLIDINGMVLQQHTKKLQKGLQNINIYADVPPGSYILKVQVGDKKALSATVIKE